jgi:hypothetical protein
MRLCLYERRNKQSGWWKGRSGYEIISFHLIPSIGPNCVMNQPKTDRTSGPESLESGEQHQIRQTRRRCKNDGFEMCDRQDQIAGCGVLKVDEHCPDDNQYSSTHDKQVTTRAREDLKRNSNRTGMTR